MSKMETLITALFGNAVLLAVIAYLANEVRSDVRETRDKVTIMWHWFRQHIDSGE